MVQNDRKTVSCLFSKNLFTGFTCFAHSRGSCGLERRRDDLRCSSSKFAYIAFLEMSDVDLIMMDELLACREDVEADMDGVG